MISIYFKLPLIEEPLPTISHSPLTLYMISRFMTTPTIYTEEWIGDLYTFATNSIKEFEESNLKKILKVFDEDLIRAIKDSWLLFPSDIRPGLNHSNLLSHSLLTSSLSWCIAINKGLTREESVLVRLTALLHDLGKPFNYKEHYKVSPKIAEYLFERIPISKDDRERIVEFVEKHHIDAASPITMVLKEADEAASSIDRVTKVAENLLKDELTDVALRFNLNKENAYKSGETSWNFWRKVGEDSKRIKEISEKFVTKVRNLPEKEFNKMFEGSEKKDLSLCCVDIGNIQSFIMRTKELRCVAAASMLIDIATVAYIPLLIQLEIERCGMGWLPFEAFLYNLGGIVVFTAPTKIAEYLESGWDRIRRRFKGYFDIYFAKTPLSTSYYETSGNLASDVALKKISTEPLREEVKQIIVRTSPKERCSKCYSEAPTTQTEYGEKLCKLCSELYTFGSKFHFARRWESELFVKNTRFKPSECFNLTYEELLSRNFDIMYFIAGHTKDEIEAQERKRNLALVKIDGNLMGAFFAKSISIADAVERSMRVDLALKESFEEAASRIFENISRIDGVAAKQVLAALKLGLLYMGGDDALIICPSWVALPLTIDVAEAFKAKMGGECSLSIGLVAAPPEHDIWALIDGASKLLDEAKKVGRVSDSGALCFDVVESGILSGETAVGRFKELTKYCLTAQPFTILKEHTSNRISISEILEIVGLGEKLENIYEGAFCASRLDKKGNLYTKKLKRIRDAVRNSIKISGDFTKNNRFKVTLIFTHYMAKEEYGDEKEKAYSVLTHLFKIWFERRYQKIGFPLSDVDRIIKILGGGVI